MLSVGALLSVGFDDGITVGAVLMEGFADGILVGLVEEVGL